MGLLRSVESTGGHARVELLLTSGWCPFAARVLTDVEDAITAQPGVDSCDVEIVWDEAWTTDRLSESATRKLRFLPDPVAVRDRDAYVAAQPPRRTAMIGDAFVFDGVAHPFNFTPKNAYGSPGEMFANHLYAFHATLTPDGADPPDAPTSSSRSGRRRTSGRWSTTSPTPTCWSRCRCR